jgi:hypothetical protein
MNIPVNTYYPITIPGYQLTKSKETYPISLDQVKRHLRLDNDFMDDDDYIQDLIYASTQLAENYLGKDISKTLNTLRIDQFDDDTVQIMDGNFISVVSVKDSNGSAIGTIHQTSTHYDYFTIEWVTSVASDPIEIKYYTGYDTCPEVIKQSILIKCADLYDNTRTSLIYSGLTDSKVFENLLESYKSIRF